MVNYSFYFRLSIRTKIDICQDIPQHLNRSFLRILVFKIIEITHSWLVLFSFFPPSGITETKSRKCYVFGLRLNQNFLLLP